MSHDATAKEYVIVNSTAGHLKEAIAAANKDYTKLKNLKIKGEINAKDFFFMRDNMNKLSAVNLKEVRILEWINPNNPGEKHSADNIPVSAFNKPGGGGLLNLVTFVFPDRLKVICDNAFTGCNNLSGSLIIPEGVEEIRRGAFTGCSSLNGSLSLPSTLKKLGTSGDGVDKDTKDEGIDYYNGVFQNCSNLTGRLIIPDGVEIIRGFVLVAVEVYMGMSGIAESLETIRRGSFNGCFGIGSIVCKGTMPAYIESGAFYGVAKDNFTLEVPESAIQQYQAAGGWCDFKRIAAHHELVCRPSVACALSTQHKQTLVINAEGEWEVESKLRQVCGMAEDESLLQLVVL